MAESTAAGAVFDQKEELSAANTLRAVSSDPIPTAPKHLNPKPEVIIEESPVAIIPKIVAESPAAVCVCVASKHTNPKIKSDDMRRILEEINDIKEILLDKMKKRGNTNGRGGSSKLKITQIVMLAVGLTLYVSAYLYSHYLMERLGLLILLVSSLITIINLWLH